MARLDFRRSLVKRVWERSAGSFPEKRLEIEPSRRLTLRNYMIRDHGISENLTSFPGNEVDENLVYKTC